MVSTRRTTDAIETSLTNGSETGLDLLLSLVVEDTMFLKLIERIKLQAPMLPLELD